MFAPGSPYWLRVWLNNTSGCPGLQA